MKLGVAISGCGIGGAAAFALLEELKLSGFDIAAISASAFPAVSAMLWSQGYLCDQIEEQMKQFLSDCDESGFEPALSRLCETTPLTRKMSPSFSIGCADVSSGISVIFSDELFSDSWQLKTLPFEGKYDALRSCNSPYHGLSPHALGNYRLCDFSIRQGMPFFPLKMSGVDRIIAVQFTPDAYTDVCEIASESLSQITGTYADLYLRVPSASPFDLQQGILSTQDTVRCALDTLYDKLLFNRQR